MRAALFSTLLLGPVSLVSSLAITRVDHGLSRHPASRASLVVKPKLVARVFSDERQSPDAPMGAEDQAFTEQALDDAIALATFAQRVPRGDAQFRAFFRSDDVYDDVMRIFNMVQNIDRSSVNFIRASNIPGAPATAAAGWDIDTRDILLFDNFFQLPNLAAQAGTAPGNGVTGTRSVSALTRMMATPGPSLLHELVHLVSNGQIGHLAGLAQSAFTREGITPPPEMVLDPSRAMVTDMQLGFIRTPGDQEVIGSRGLTTPQYGASRTLTLAQMQLGDIGAAFNADSYRAFATAALVDFIPPQPVMPQGIWAQTTQPFRDPVIATQALAEFLRLMVASGAIRAAIGVGIGKDPTDL